MHISHDQQHLNCDAGNDIPGALCQCVAGHAATNACAMMQGCVLQCCFPLHRMSKYAVNGYVVTCLHSTPWFANDHVDLVCQHANVCNITIYPRTCSTSCMPTSTCPLLTLTPPSKGTQPLVISSSLTTSAMSKVVGSGLNTSSWSPSSPSSSHPESRQHDGCSDTPQQHTCNHIDHVMITVVPFGRRCMLFVNMPFNEHDMSHACGIVTSMQI